MLFKRFEIRQYNIYIITEILVLSLRVTSLLLFINKFRVFICL